MAVLEPLLFGHHPRLPADEADFLPARKRVWPQALTPQGKTVNKFRYYNPFWPTTTPAGLWMTAHGVSSAAIAGAFTFLDGVHPLTNTEKEQVVRVDGNAAHVLSLQNFTYATPDFTRRWAMRTSIIVRLPSANNLPASAAFIMGAGSAGGGPNAWELYLTTTGALLLREWSNAGVSTDFTSTLTLAFDDTWAQWEVWHVMCTSAGAALPTVQCVVRLITNLTTTRDATTWINALSGEPRDGSRGGAASVVGEGTTRGAGFGWDFCNLFSSIEDANQPWGVIRGDAMVPDGNGIKAEWDDQNSADVLDKMADATLANRVPDDATTVDTLTITSVNVKKYNSYDVAAPGYITGSDGIIGVVLAGRAAITVLAKGQSDSMNLAYTDGTTTRDNQDPAGTISGTGIGSYADLIGYAPTTAGSRSWTSIELANLEVGIWAQADFAAQSKVSTMQAIAVYEASGETTPAPVTAPLPVQLMGKMKSAMKFEDYSAVQSRRWNGILNQATPPVVGTRRRQTSVS